MTDLNKELDATIKSRLYDIETKSKIHALKLLIKYRSIAQTTQLVKESVRIDLLFVLDCTGSMQPMIENVKNTIGEVSERLLQTVGAYIRVGFVGYRDYGDSDVYST